jgi:hypothetical protein
MDAAGVTACFRSVWLIFVVKINVVDTLQLYRTDAHTARMLMHLLYEINRMFSRQSRRNGTSFAELVAI